MDWCSVYLTPQALPKYIYLSPLLIFPTTSTELGQKTARCESLRALLHYVEWDRIVTLTKAQADWGLRYLGCTCKFDLVFKKKLYPMIINVWYIKFECRREFESQGRGRYFFYGSLKKRDFFSVILEIPNMPCGLKYCLNKKETSFQLFSKFPTCPVVWNIA